MYNELDMCGVEEREGTGARIVAVAVVVLVVDNAKGRQTGHPNDVESLEQVPALDRTQVESPLQPGYTVGERLEVTSGR